jgi:hypothetical protein
MILFQDEEDRVEDEDDDEDDEIQPYRYYESDKILGKLYRAVDEREIFKYIQQTGGKEESPGTYKRIGYSDITLMNAIWAYVKKRCRLLKWQDHLNWARDVRDW